jgi:hypothetical protein
MKGFYCADGKNKTVSPPCVRRSVISGVQRLPPTDLENEKRAKSYISPADATSAQPRRRAK